MHKYIQHYFQSYRTAFNLSPVCDMWHLRTWWRYLAVLCSWLDWIILKAFSNLNDFMFLYRKQRTPSAFTFLALIIMSRTALHYPEKPRSSSLSNIYWDVSRNRRYFLLLGVTSLISLCVGVFGLEQIHLYFWTAEKPLAAAVLYMWDLPRTHELWCM